MCNKSIPNNHFYTGGIHTSTNSLLITMEGWDASVDLFKVHIKSAGPFVKIRQGDIKLNDNEKRCTIKMKLHFLK